MANITQTLVDDSIPVMVAATALQYLKGNTVMMNLVARDWDSEVAEAGQSVKIPFTGALSVNAKAADTDITLQTPADTAVTVTLDQHNEVSFVIEDIAEAFSRPDYMEAYTNDAMAVIAEEIDTDLLALYSGFSQTIDATAGLAEDDLRETARQLDAAKVPQSGRNLVLHEDAAYEARGIERIINRDYAEAVGRLNAANFIGNAYGFDMYLDQQVAVATSQAKNIAFHRNAIAMVVRPLPVAQPGQGVSQATVSEDGMSVRVTRSYDHDKLGNKLTIDVLYGVAELRDNHAVVISTTEM